MTISYQLESLLEFSSFFSTQPRFDRGKEFLFLFFLIEVIGISVRGLFCSVTRSNVIRCQSKYNYNGNVKRMRKIKCILIVGLRNKILNDDENEKPGF